MDSPANPNKDFIIKSCQLKKSEPLKEYVPIDVQDPTYEDKSNRIRKYDIGESNMSATEKVILMVGATGSGKSTLINAMFNYIFGVKWEDNFRLKLVEEKVPKSGSKYHKVHFILHFTSSRRFYRTLHSNNN